MTTTVPDPKTASALDDGASGAGFGRLLVSEWTKLGSVRSTMWSLLLLAVLTLGFAALFTWLTVSQWDKSSGSQQRQIVADPVGMILGAGFQLSQLSVCVLGVMVMASEYSTGMIGSSLLAVPNRTPMLWAKCVVFGVLVFVVGELVAFPSFLIGAPILHSKAPVGLGDPGVLRAIFGAGLYLAGFVLVLAPLAQLLPGSVGEHIHAYLPSEAGRLVAQSRQGPNDLLTPWQGFGVFAIWTAVLLTVAGLSAQATRRLSRSAGLSAAAATRYGSQRVRRNVAGPNPFVTAVKESVQ